MWLLAMWALLHWTNPTNADSIWLVQVRAPGDTVVRALWQDQGGYVKKFSRPGLRDSGYVSISTSNYTSGSIRFLLFTSNKKGRSLPSNPYSLFYRSVDTLYWGPRGGEWGKGLSDYPQALGDSTWVSWEHFEVIQQNVLDRLCLLFKYGVRRGVRDSIWCQELK